MGNKKRNKEININVDITRPILRGSAGSVTKRNLTVCINQAIIDYLYSQNAFVFSKDELNTLCNDICNNFLESTDEELYKNIQYILNFDDEEFRGEFLFIIGKLYDNKKYTVDLSKLEDKFEVGYNIYKPIIIHKILSNSEICKRLRDYSKYVIKESNKILNVLDEIMMFKLNPSLYDDLCLGSLLDELNELDMNLDSPLTGTENIIDLDEAILEEFNLSDNEFNSLTIQQPSETSEDTALRELLKNSNSLIDSK